MQDVLHSTVSGEDGGAAACLTFMSKSKWVSTKVSLTGLNEHTLHVRIDSENGKIPGEIVIDQPVGISLSKGIDVYIFETPVVGFEASVNDGKGGVIVLEMPESLERMQRRAFTRVNVPGDLHVKVLFWHRGYLDVNYEPPLENYWQGDLVDLSAGGLQISISNQQGNNFKISQVVGLQFTPMPYQKPIIIEGQVKRINNKGEDTIVVGIEFLGIESCVDGRDKLYRIIDTVSEYEHKNAEKYSQVAHD